VGAPRLMPCFGAAGGQVEGLVIEKGLPMNKFCGFMPVKMARAHVE